MAELTYTRVFDAPRELVFRCMLEPEHLTHFWGPAGTSAPLDGITVDPRPGGVFETVMINDADGGSYAMCAVYTEIVPPERIVWTEPGTGMITTSTFTDLGGTRTEVRIHQADVPDSFRSPEDQARFLTSLDRFAAHLETLVP
ncbi:MAG TPA: SRPBCC domain-containing protein [Streptosporangiaceae bacterium]|nr:SRPBCC domain-containing protein [Streptosporangiaceae bacterium]